LAKFFVNALEQRDAFVHAPIPKDNCATDQKNDYRDCSDSNKTRNSTTHMCVPSWLTRSAYWDFENAEVRSVTM
jgi:hypothetical protein